MDLELLVGEKKCDVLGIPITAGRRKMLGRITAKFPSEYYSAENPRKYADLNSGEWKIKTEGNGTHLQGWGS